MLTLPLFFFRIWAFLSLSKLLLGTNLIQAQSLPTPQDSLKVGFYRTVGATSLYRTLPAKARYRESARLLTELPGSWLYDLGAMGWAHGWSAYGLSPNGTALSLQGLPFQHLLTEVPAFEMLPTGSTSTITTLHSPQGQPLQINADLRNDLSTPVYTEARYDGGSDGDGQGWVSHRQRRKVKWFRQDGFATFYFGAASHKATNEYPSSQTVGSNLLLRLQYERPAYSLEWIALHSRNKAGAQGRVLPTGTNFNTIYDRRLQTVLDPGRTRHLQRNDLALLYRTKRYMLPTTAAIFWQTEQFSNFKAALADTQQVRLHRYGVWAVQPFKQGQHHGEAALRMGLDHAAPSTLLHTSRRLYPFLHLSLQDSLHVGQGAVRGTLGLHLQKTHFYPSAQLAWQRKAWFAEIKTTRMVQGWLQRFGMDSLTVSLDTQVLAQQRSGQTYLARLKREFSHQELSGLIQIHLQASPQTLLPLISNTKITAFSQAKMQQAGLSGELRWREQANKGFWGMLQVNGAYTTTSLALQSLPLFPRLNSTLRWGARFALFENDLRANLYAQVRFWTKHKGLAFHSRSGLWGYDAATEAVPFSVVLDLLATAQIRSATVFISGENLLYGWTGSTGTYRVPNFPLADRSYRLGVYWPLTD